MAALPSTLWTCKIIHRFGDPSTLWRLYRPLCGLVKLFTVLVIRPLVAALPSILWTSKVVNRHGISVHFVAAVPSIFWTCNDIHRFGDPST